MEEFDEEPLSYSELGWFLLFDTILWECEMKKSKLRKQYADLKRQYDSTLKDLNREKDELERLMSDFTSRMNQMKRLINKRMKNTPTFTKRDVEKALSHDEIRETHELKRQNMYIEDTRSSIEFLVELLDELNSRIIARCTYMKNLRLAKTLETLNRVMESMSGLDLSETTDRITKSVNKVTARSHLMDNVERANMKVSIAKQMVDIRGADTDIIDLLFQDAAVTNECSSMSEKATEVLGVKSISREYS